MKELLLLPTEKSVKAEQYFEAAYQTLNYLAQRWQDEREYENIQEYKDLLQKMANRFGVTVTRMTKRPFGCEFEVDSRTYQFVSTSKGISYKRIHWQNVIRGHQNAHTVNWEGDQYHTAQDRKDHGPTSSRPEDWIQEAGNHDGPVQLSGILRFK